MYEQKTCSNCYVHTKIALIRRVSNIGWHTKSDASIINILSVYLFFLKQQQHNTSTKNHK